MPLLDGKRVYLSAPMEFSSAGNEWQNKTRKWVKHVLTEEFKLKVFDPYDDPFQNIAEKVKKLKSEGNYEEVRKIAKPFVNSDLALTDRADILVAYVPYKVATVGVTHEIINANNAKKVTLLVEGTDKSKISTWYSGFISDKYMFGIWEDLFSFLRDVNADKYKDNHRFHFLYNYPHEWLN